MTLKRFFGILGVGALIDFAIWRMLVVLHVANNNILAGMVIFIVLAVIWVSYDVRRYPVCPNCGNNLRTFRPKLAEDVVICSKHGSFRDD